MTFKMLLFPAELRSQLMSEARAAFPRECCGLIEGVKRGNTIAALALHPARNLANRADRFEIDPMEQFRLLHALRGTERDIIGCYHSHPNGKAAPSTHDLAMAAEEDFVWLIAATDAPQGNEIAAFLYREGRFENLKISN